MRHRIRPLDEPFDAGATELPALDGDTEMIALLESDSTWCTIYEEPGPRRWYDTILDALDRWARSGHTSVRTGPPDVYRVLRLPSDIVCEGLGRWSTAVVVAGSSRLVLAAGGPMTLRGVFEPHRVRRPATIEISFERWSADLLCAHLTPVGQSATRAGSPPWWSAAHDLLDALEVELRTRAGYQETSLAPS